MNTHFQRLLRRLTRRAVATPSRIETQARAHDKQQPLRRTAAVRLASAVLAAAAVAALVVGVTMAVQPTRPGPRQVLGAATAATATTSPTGGNAAGAASASPEPTATSSPTAAAATPSSTATATPTASPTEAASDTASALPDGYYADETSNHPRYVLTLSHNGSGFTGWLFFIYQDGRISVLSHYIAMTDADQTFTLRTDDRQRSSFPYAHRSPVGPQAGSTPLPAGNTHLGTYGQDTLTLTGCPTYLYWANSHFGSPPESCTFHYAPSTVGYSFNG